MVINETSTSISEIIQLILPSMLEKFSPMFNVLKIAGIVFIVYIAILIIQAFLRMKDRRRLKRIEEKLDILLKKTSATRKH
jgi:threonine/homoserine/homoserine lactone efflux protein